MIYELAEIRVIAGHEEAFIAAVAQAKPLFLAAPGCHGLSLTRTVERPELFRLLVRWETVEAHMVGFRNSDSFAEWRQLVGPHFAEPPHVEHLAVAIPE